MSARKPRRHSRVIVHLALLSCAALFLFPFVWMAASSLKTDEELHAPGIFPAMPRFRGQSPYARPVVSEVRPAGVPLERWERALPRLREKASQAVRSAMK